MPPEKSIDGYTFSVFWSDEDQEYVGQCHQFQSLSWIAKSPEDALDGIRRLVQECLGDMSTTEPPAFPGIGAAKNQLVKAISARYTDEERLLVVVLSNGHTLRLNPEDIQGLVGATTHELLDIELSPSGLGLHFPALDTDVYVPALLAGRLGTLQWMKNLKDASSRTPQD